MSPYTKKFIKNFEAKVLPATIIALMIIASFAAIFVINPNSDIRVKAASTTDFLYNKKITIDHTQVLDDLGDFVVPINISSDTDLANTVLEGSKNGWDIAFFNSEGNQLDHEIEYFNGDTGQLVAWVECNLKNTTDTEIYMYYGDADISASAENVAGTWSSNLTAVYHFRNLSDSKGTYDLTNTGSVTINDTDGSFGGCADFGTADDRYLSQASLLNTVGNAFTITCYLYPLTLGDDGEDEAEGDDYIFNKIQEVPDENIFFFYNDLPDRNFRLRTKTGEGDYNDYDGFENNLLTNEWSYLGLAYQDNTANTHIADNNYTQTAETSGVLNDGSAGDFYIGTDDDTTLKMFDGRMDELRIYNIKLSENWLKTEYNAFTNATDGGFFTFGEEESGVEGDYEIAGLGASTKFTFSGQAGDTVWCNDTSDGTANETLYIYTNNTGTTDNCTQINLVLVDADADIVKTNFSVEVINLTDGSWDGTVTAIPAGGNLTLNSSQWANAWCHGTDPFPIQDNTTICVRIKVAIPAGIGVGTKSNSGNCYVKWLVDIP